MSKEARVFIAHPDIVYRRTVSSLLRKYGYVVVREVDTLVEALAFLDESPDESLDLAMFADKFDGDMDGGLLLSQAFKQKFPGKGVLSLSLIIHTWSDKPRITRRSSPQELLKAIKELIEVESEDNT